MAKVNNGAVSGLVGTVVLYKLNGKSVMRARPMRYKNTKASQQAAKNFGRASRMGRVFRQQLHGAQGGYKQAGTRYRLTSALSHWLRNGRPAGPGPGYYFIDKFQFNEKCSLVEKLKVLPTVDFSNDKKILVNIPTLIPTWDLHTPPNTESIEWCIDAYGESPDDRGGNDPYGYVVINMPNNDKKIAAQTLEISFDDPYMGTAERLILVALSLKYTVNINGQKKQLEELEWRPGGVIGYCYK